MGEKDNLAWWRLAHSDAVSFLLCISSIVTDVEEPVGPDNPLRQVIINTHSLAVVGQVPDDSLLVAELKELTRGGERFKRLAFSYLPDTWRQQEADDQRIVSRGKLLAYLHPLASADETIASDGLADQPAEAKHGRRTRRSVASRPDLQQLLLPFGEEA
jgi:hypothetical protein